MLSVIAKRTNPARGKPNQDVLSLKYGLISGASWGQLRYFGFNMSKGNIEKLSDLPPAPPTLPKLLNSRNEKTIAMI